MPLITDSDTQSPFPLMRMPLKLRQQIYEYALVSDTPIEIHEASRRRRSSVSRGAPIEAPGRMSALLRTSRQIRNEAASHYFSKNQFVIPWGFPNLGCQWLQGLEAQHRQALRDVKFCYGDGAFWTVYDARTALTSLKLMLERTGAYADLKEARLWVPVCEFGVHTWTELKGRKDAQWVSMDQIKRFSDGKEIVWRM